MLGGYETSEQDTGRSLPQWLQSRWGNTCKQAMKRAVVSFVTEKTQSAVGEAWTWEAVS